MVIGALKWIVRYGGKGPRFRLTVDVIGVVLAVLVFWWLWNVSSQQNRAARDGEQAHHYLCLRKNVFLPKQIQRSLDYKIAVQEGKRKPIPGLTIQDITNAIKDAQDEIDQLGKIVKCK